jgi:hypothetical protein
MRRGLRAGVSSGSALRNTSARTSGVGSLSQARTPTVTPTVQSKALMPHAAEALTSEALVPHTTKAISAMPTRPRSTSLASQSPSKPTALAKTRSSTSNTALTPFILPATSLAKISKSWSPPPQSSNGQVVGNAHADFYVNPLGEMLPATAYRHFDSQYLAQTQSTGVLPLKYFGFENFKTASAARDGMQIARQWSNARGKATFDTLQLARPDGTWNARVPRAEGDQGPHLEPITSTYPQYGKGGYAQLVPQDAGTSVRISHATEIPEQ